MADLIDRQAAIDRFENLSYADWNQRTSTTWANAFSECADMIRDFPSAQPTLYGYRIEHLAYIARIMEKEGVTAEYAIRTFDDIKRAIKMIMDETRELVERSICHGD